MGIFGNNNNKEKKEGGNSFFSSSKSKIKVVPPRQIIKPYLNRIDSYEISNRIYGSRDAASNNSKKGDKKNSAGNSFSKIVPQHLIDDIYQLYYTPSGSMKLETPHITNRLKYSIIEKINNFAIKIISNNSHIGSYVFTDKISEYIYDMISELTPEQQQQFIKGMDECNQGNDDGEGDSEGDGEDEDGEEGNGKGKKSGGKGAGKETDPNKSLFMDQKKLDQELNKKLDSPKAQEHFKNKIKEAEKIADDLDKAGFDIHSGSKTNEDTKEMLDNLSNLDSFRRQVQAIDVNKNNLFKAIEKILDKSMNYFSRKSHRNEVELFDAEELLDIDGLEYLHPIFQNTKLMDMSVIEKKYYGKFDIYIDVSGSMSSSSGVSGVSKLLFAKAMAIHMKSIGILNDVYVFDTSVTKIKNSEIGILLINDGGGTSFQCVTNKISETKNNSVILTDMEDSVHTHIDNVFFVGVKGASPHYLSGTTEGKKYLDNGQCIFYDGDKFTNSFSE